MNRFTYLLDEQAITVSYEWQPGRLLVGGQSYDCDGRSVVLDGRRVPFWTHRDGDTVSVWLDGQVHRFCSHDPRQRQQAKATEGGSGTVAAQMPGKVLTLSVQPGAVVSKGENLLVMESMKMELALDAPIDGTVVSVAVAVGQMVAQGECLVVLEPAAPA